MSPRAPSTPAEPGHDLTRFSLVDMAQCGARLRALGSGAHTQAEIGERVARLLHRGFVDAETRRHQCTSVRVFKTLPFSDLPADLRALAERGTECPLDERSRCLVQIAATGADGEERRSSSVRPVVALADPGVATKEPLIADMLQGFGVALPADSGPLLPGDEPRPLDVFHIADAVSRHGARSVLAFGGALPGNEIFAVVLSCRVPVSAATAAMFAPLALSTLSAFLQVHPAAVFAGQEREREPERRTFAARTYEALLDAQDRILVEQWQRVAAAEEDRDRFFSLSLDMLCVADLDGYFKRVNPAFTRTLGYTAEELTSRPFTDLVHPDDRPATEEVMAQLAHGGDVEQFYNRYRCKDGSYRWLSWSCPAPADGGELYAVARDITHNVEQERRLKEAREEAEAASRAKDTFLANMSHEIRTPLNSILGFTQLVLETEIEPFQRHWLDKVVGSGHQLVRIINDILDFSKMQAGKFHLEAAWFDLRETVERAVEGLAPQAHGGGLELIARIDDDVPGLVHGDALRVGQVLTNLLANAIKFTRVGEVEIRVGCRAIDSERSLLLVDVRDTGIGIPEELQDQVFAPFSQADMSSSRRFAGTGLGLSICHSLVTQMGGEIGVESTPGKGSTFHVTLPLAHGAAPPRSTELPGLAGLRIVVVDDNATARAALVHRLRSWATEPSAHATAEEALAEVTAAVAADDPVPVLITDHEMPGTDGFALVEAVRSVSPSTRSIVLLTTVDLSVTTDRADNMGIASIVKPVHSGKLLETLLGVTPGAAPGPGSSDTLAERTARALRILLAEDSETNEALFVSLLRRRGHEVVVAHDGGEALERARAETFDVILMDVQMPVLDGIDVTRMLRDDEARGARVPPIIALTARATRADQRACLAAGMADCIIKPIDIPTFYATIDRVVGTPPAHSGIDWAAALATAGGDQDLLNRLIASAHQELPRLIAGIGDAVAAGDLSAAARHAHTLRSVAGHLGATAVERDARQLQTAARSERTADVAATFARLEGRAARLLASLDDAARTGGPG